MISPSYDFALSNAFGSIRGWRKGSCVAKNRAWFEDQAASFTTLFLSVGGAAVVWRGTLAVVVVARLFVTVDRA